MEFPENLRKEVKILIEDKIKRKLTDKELDECCVSLYFLGKSIARFIEQKYERQTKQ